MLDRTCRSNHLLIALAAGAMLGACTVSDDTDTPDATNGAPAAAPPPVAQPAPFDSARVRFVVDLSDRQLYVLEGQDTIRREPVAVGMEDHPTPTGEWAINRVDWNPDWTPPPGEDWTEDAEQQPPGSPDNPMGRARLVFEPLYSIHGTKDRASLGTNESHGSIRVSNPAVLELGRLVMDEGGATRPESFFSQVEADRTTMHQVPIPDPIPIRVQQ